MLLRAGHAPQRVGETCRYYKDRKHLQKIGEWSWVLKGMGAIGIEEASAVGAQHFNGFLGGNRSLRYGLVRHSIHDRFAVRTDSRLSVLPHMRYWLRLHDLHGVIGLEVL